MSLYENSNLIHQAGPPRLRIEDSSGATVIITDEDRPSAPGTAGLLTLDLEFDYWPELSMEFYNQSVSNIGYSTGKRKIYSFGYGYTGSMVFNKISQRNYRKLISILNRVDEHDETVILTVHRQLLDSAGVETMKADTQEFPIVITSGLNMQYAPFYMWHNVSFTFVEAYRMDKIPSWWK